MGMMRAPLCRFAALTLVLAAMLLRGVLPAGWMPGPVHGRNALLTICTLSGPVHVDPEIDGRSIGHKPGHDNRQRADNCPFAGAPQSATLGGPVSLSLPVIASITERLPLQNEAAIDLSRFFLHPARAPPVAA